MHATQEHNLPLTLHLYAALQTVKRLSAHRLQYEPSSVSPGAAANIPGVDSAAEMSTETDFRGLLVYVTLLLGRINQGTNTLIPSDTSQASYYK